MKIDSAIQTFTEKYDTKAINSIEDLSNEYGLRIHKKDIDAFNINESFNQMRNFLKLYVECVKGDRKDMNLNKEEFDTAFHQYMKDSIFKESDDYKVLYTDLPKFIKSYIEGVKLLIADVNEYKNKMLESGVAPEAVGNIDEYMDSFMESMDNKFHPFMDKLLWASGYYSNAILYEGKKMEKPITATEFI